MPVPVRGEVKGSPCVDPAGALICRDLSAASRRDGTQPPACPRRGMVLGAWREAVGAPSLACRTGFPRSTPPEAVLPCGDPASCHPQLRRQTQCDVGPGRGQGKQAPGVRGGHGRGQTPSSLS